MPLDIASGILLSLLVAHGFGIQADAALLAFGILSALLPDIDMLPVFARTAHDHRSSFHWPLSYLPVAILVFFLDPLYGTLFTLSILAHFVHDTIGIGWGVAWLAPFSERKILFPEKGRRIAYGRFMSWLPEEEEKMAQKYHDPHWLRTYYFRPNPIAFVEYGAFVVSILVLFVYYGAI